MKAYGEIKNKSMFIWIKPYGVTEYKMFTNWADAIKYGAQFKN